MPIDQFQLPYNSRDLAIARRLVWVYAYDHEGERPAFGDVSQQDVATDFQLCADHERTALELAQMLNVVRASYGGVANSKQKANCLRFGIQMLCCFWLAVTDELPSGRFPDSAVGNQPAMDSAAGFVSCALRAVGYKFTDGEFRKKFNQVCDEFEKTEGIARAILLS